MIILGFVGGPVRIGKITLQPREVIQLPDDNARELLAANKGVCNLTPNRILAPFGVTAPRRLARILPP